MPKRPNPFGDSSPLQFKTHVGKKEVDMGVNMEDNMKNVYDRTKELLFHGSTKTGESLPCYGGIDILHADLNGIDRGEADLCPSKGQLRLDQHGYLCGAQPPVATSAPEKTLSASVASAAEVSMDTAEAGCIQINNNKGSPQKSEKQLKLDAHGRLCGTESSIPPGKQAGTVGFRICQSCNRPSNMGTRRCNFCDKATCSNCLRSCDGCQGLFCQLCSVLNYDDCMEKSFCLHCAA